MTTLVLAFVLASMLLSSVYTMYMLNQIRLYKKAVNWNTQAIPMEHFNKVIEMRKESSYSFWVAVLSTVVVYQLW